MRICHMAFFYIKSHFYMYVVSSVFMPVSYTHLDVYKRQDDISAKELADSVFVSQQYLSRVFTEFMNCSVYEYLTNYRINKAKELLLSLIHIFHTPQAFLYVRLKLHC